jgi:hypothetical protein
VCAFARQKPQVSLAQNHGLRDLSYSLASLDNIPRLPVLILDAERPVCSKEMLLSGPEGLEGQKIREAQHEFSTPAHANASLVLHPFYRDGQS